jgi:hypothetical protein
MAIPITIFAKHRFERESLRKTSQTCSVGFNSGEYAGKDNNVLLKFAVQP